MNRRSTQFGVRENTASPRQHASRLAVNSLPLRPDGPPCTPHESEPRQLPTIPAAQPLPAAITIPQNEATQEENGDRSPLLTIKEVAELLRVPVSWVYGRTRNRGLGRMPGYRLGKYWRFSEAEVLAWVKSQRGGSSAS
jgi:excisionase family DNA binding protein